LPSTVRIKRLGAYEVKRGNGQFDAGKIRSIKRNLLCVQVLLKSYGAELAKLKPVAAESRIIFYFGVRLDIAGGPDELAGRACRAPC
jgi:hypothetical protein